MKTDSQFKIATLLLIWLSLALHVSAAEWRGSFGLENRYFLEDALQGQDNEQYSLRIEPEFSHSSEESSSLFTFQLFVREDSLDDERSHADIRELSWLTYGDDWEFKLGISKVFWGVAETKHLVDIINQTDAIENIDGEDKLGQPMLNLTLIRDWGTVDFFVLPIFRERTFAGIDGRFRAPLAVDVEHPLYASADEDKHVDTAIRWSHTLGDWDIGLSHFSGTSRDPILVPKITEQGVVLQPLYNTIDQTGLDIQATLDIWLWKLEVISNQGYDNDRFTAAVGGFEYSFYDVAESGIDIGMILEVQYDSRAIDVSGLAIENTIVFGQRYAFNDEQSTELLLGISVNEKSHNIFWNIEASRRLGDTWKLTLEARIISNVDDSITSTSPLFAVRKDSFVMLDIARYF